MPDMLPEFPERFAQFAEFIGFFSCNKQSEVIQTTFNQHRFTTLSFCFTPII